MLFVGIDLAWSEKNSSGMAILEGSREKLKLIFHGNLLSDEEILEVIKEKVKEKNAIISIDAPLIVPNKTGRRVAEKLVGDLFRKYHAGAHPSNRNRLSSWTGTIRGEEISKLLIKEGFQHNPNFKKLEETRKFFEVYPHPSMVVLFNLDMILRYKSKPKRDYDFRWEEFKKYQSYLGELKSLSLPNEIIKIDVRTLRGKALKKYEDILDAIFCAYLSFYHWKYPDKCSVLGNMKEGYISTPVF